LGEVLQKNITLTTLMLGSNQIGATGMKAFGEALEKNTTVTTLDLNYNQISDAGAGALGKALVKNTILTTLSLNDNQISNAGAKVLSEALRKNSTLTMLSLYGNQISDVLIQQINSLIIRNRRYLKELQVAVCQQLKVGRILLYKAYPNESEDSLFLAMPLEMREKIVTHAVENIHLTNEQQRLVLNYAEGKKAPLADKLSFFKVTKCDRVRKLFMQDGDEAVSCSHISMV
jgi:hypothetical protein